MATIEQWQKFAEQLRSNVLFWEKLRDQMLAEKRWDAYQRASHTVDALSYLSMHIPQLATEPRAWENFADFIVMTRDCWKNQADFAGEQDLDTAVKYTLRKLAADGLITTSPKETPQCSPVS